MAHYRIYGKGVVVELEYLVPSTFSVAQLKAAGLAVDEPFRFASNVDVLVERVDDTVDNAILVILAGQELHFKPFPNETVRVTWIAPYEAHEKAPKDPLEFAPDFVAYISVTEANN